MRISDWSSDVCSSDLIKQWPDFAELYKLKGQSEERLGKKVDARRAMAKYYEQTGALPTAVEQLRQARELSSDFYEQSELDSEIRRVKQRLATAHSRLEKLKKSPGALFKPVPLNPWPIGRAPVNYPWAV